MLRFLIIALSIMLGSVQASAKYWSCLDKNLTAEQRAECAQNDQR